MERAPKRPRTDGGVPDSLSRPVSPPAQRQGAAAGRALASPWELTWIRDLGPECNRDAVTITDLLGDPLIRECWQFNFLFDLPFLMRAFDADARHLVKVHVIHGFWKTEDPRRRTLSVRARQAPLAPSADDAQQEAAELGNVVLHCAPMPEMLGTHHSKMMVLFRRDDTAQVIIHTANMIAVDWTNMTNAVWRSPRLPKLGGARRAASDASTPPPTPGSGAAFQSDLFRYLRWYDRHKRICAPLVDELGRYDFGDVRAALVASVPGRHDAKARAWGWAALGARLRGIACRPGNSEIVVEVSSMATLGAKDEWLQKTLFDSLAGAATGAATRPRFKVVFPTADEVARSLDGYASGASIHAKVQSPQQAKQLGYLRPLLHHWANDSPHGRALPAGSDAVDGGRRRAAPHVKKYIQYNDDETVAWALLTSANLSRQAWGEAARASGEMRIASWELGVLVWPGLYGPGSAMVGSSPSGGEGAAAGAGMGGAAVGLRIPYSLPLQRYGPDEVPWVASMRHAEPDSRRRTWLGAPRGAPRGVAAATAATANDDADPSVEDGTRVGRSPDEAPSGG